VRPALIVSTSFLGIGAVALGIGAAAAAANNPDEISWDSQTYTVTQRDEGETQLVEVWREGEAPHTVSVSLDLLCERSNVLRVDADGDGVTDLVVDDCGHYKGLTMRDGAIAEVAFGESVPPGLRTLWGSSVQDGGASLLCLGALAVIGGVIGLLVAKSR